MNEDIKLEEGEDIKFGADPMYPDTPENDGEPQKEPVDVASSISQRLESVEKGEEAGKEGGVRAESPIPFDLSKMSREQIQTLKQMLASTPDTQTRKKQNPRIALRQIEGRIIEDFKNSYNGLVDDPANNRKVEKPLIPIKFYGDAQYYPVLYSTFINSDRVSCEVISSRNQTEEVIEGETISRETGMPVEMIRKDMRTWFTIKLPSGEQVEIEAKVANG